MNNGVTQRVGAAVKVTFLATLISGVVQAAVMIVLARLLHPQDYGAYAISLAVVGLTTTVVAGALERSLIVAREPKLLIGKALPITAIVALVAFLTYGATAFAKALLLPAVSMSILATLLASAIVGSLGILPRVVLRRAIAFRGIALSDVFSRAFGSGLSAIAFAHLGFGGLALALGMLVQSAVSTVILIFITRRELAWEVRPEGISSLLSGAAQLGKSSSLEIINGQAPSFLVGQLGLRALGTFNRAFTLVQLPVELLTNSMSRVLISGLVAVADDNARVARGFRSLVVLAVALMSPIVGGIVGSHAEFTAVILGAHFSAAASILPWLAMATWMAMAAHLFGVLAEALREFRLKIWVQATSTVALIIFMYTGSRYGLAAACIGLAAAMTLQLVLYIIVASKVLMLAPMKIVSWFGAGTGAGFACAVFSFLVARVLSHSPALSVLSVQVFGCGITTLIYYSVFHRRLLRQIAGYVFPGRRSATSTA